MVDLTDVTSKLSQPKKTSQFERQRAEAEAKKAREKAETLAVLAEFEKSFEDDERNAFTAPQPSRGAPAPGKRHFTSSGLKSGPGSLPKSGPGSLGPVYNKKRPFDDHDRRGRSGGLNFQSDRESREQEREDDNAAKPTLHLSSMPPGTTQSIIKGLFAHTALNVDGVRILAHSAQDKSQNERKSCTAIVTLAADTPASDIDTVVSHLQNRYLGFGFKLSLSRHLSSAAIANNALTSNTGNVFPFGARQVVQQTSLSRAPPPHQRFPPPQSYTSSTPYSRNPPTEVVVKSPSDLKQLKLIHKTLEALLTYGPEFEALLMSRPEIQRDEKWAWLWDSTSIGGVYYRWRLWNILTTPSNKNRAVSNDTLFEGQATWIQPEEPLRFEYTTQIDTFVSDEDYNSSDDDSDDGGRDLARRYNDHNAPVSTGDDVNDGMGYLNPLAKAKLTHLLRRLPNSTSKLRRGDIARITAFAIEHAGAGGDEVATLVTRNVVQPLADLEGEDWTSAAQVGLYAISDILSCSASSGVRHAWRYRTLFEAALRQQNVFQKLGRAEKDLKWGKLKGEKWKRSVQTLLSLWEGWSVFPQAVQEQFTEAFLNPPLTEEEKIAVEVEAQRKAESEAQRARSVKKWRSVEDEANSDVKMEDVDGAPMLDNQEMDVEMENIDGVPMVDSSDEEMVMKGEEQPEPPPPPPAPDRAEQVKIEVEVKAKPQPMGGRKHRPKAADMFGSDSE